MNTRPPSKNPQAFAAAFAAAVTTATTWHDNYQREHNTALRQRLALAQILTAACNPETDQAEALTQIRGIAREALYPRPADPDAR